MGGNYEKYYLKNSYKIDGENLLIDSQIDEDGFYKMVKNLAYTIKLLEQQNNKIIYINNFPKTYIDLKMYEFVNGYDLTLKKTSQFLENNSFSRNYIMNTLKEDQILDFTDLFCNNLECKYFNSQNYFFNDESHFSFYGAKLVSKTIFDYLDMIK